MSVEAYDKGDRVQFTAAFTNLAGAAADPTTIRFKVKRPDLTETTWVYGTDAQVVRDGVGAYHAEVDFDQSGDWTYRWEGTGAVQSAGERAVIVRASAFS